jgi:hypothetical protein
VLQVRGDELLYSQKQKEGGTQAGIEQILQAL